MSQHIFTIIAIEIILHERLPILDSSLEINW